MTSKPDCWIETSVRCKGGKNMDGLYILGHYPSVELGRKAYDEHKEKNPKAIILLMISSGCPEKL